MKYLIPAFLTLAILAAGQAYPSYDDAELERVIDGDTLETEEDTVRFLGMDTPETFEFTDNEPEEFGLPDNEASIECLESYGEEATEFVENHASESITLVNDRRSNDTGFYDRRLAYIYEGGDITRRLVVEGYARVYPSEFSRKNEFYFWEYVAKKNDRGLWSCS